MIEKTTAYKVGEQFFPCIEEAQRHELAQLFTVTGQDGNPTRLTVDEAAGMLIAKKDDVLNILTMTPTSHPKARKANGATRKPRKPKTERVPA